MWIADAVIAGAAPDDVPGDVVAKRGQVHGERAAVIGEWIFVDDGESHAAIEPRRLHGKGWELIAVVAQIRVPGLADAALVGLADFAMTMGARGRKRGQKD